METAPCSRVSFSLELGKKINGNFTDSKEDYFIIYSPISPHHKNKTGKIQHKMKSWQNAGESEVYVKQQLSQFGNENEFLVSLKGTSIHQVANMPGTAILYLISCLI